MAKLFWDFAAKPVLALVGGRFLYALLAAAWGKDPATELVRLVMAVPSGPWLEAGRWAILGVPAILLLVGYEWWRHQHPIGWGKLTLAEAAQLAYEAMERSGIDDMASTANSTPDVILEHFKYVILVAAEAGDIQLYGIRPPSRQSLPIPHDQLRGVHPTKDNSDLVVDFNPRRAGFTEVRVSKRDARRVISGRIALLKKVENEQTNVSRKIRQP